MKGVKSATFLVIIVLQLIGGLAAKAQDSIILAGMHKELDRSYAKLKNAGAAPLYYLGYRFYDTQSLNLSAEYGALKSESDIDHKRILNVDARVGSPHLDNTHAVSEATEYMLQAARSITPAFYPLEDNESALRTALWIRTNNAFKNSQKRYETIKSNQDLQAAETDKADDLSAEKPHRFAHTSDHFLKDVPEWKNRLRRLSKIYCEYPHILNSHVDLSVTKVRRYLVTTEGTQIEDEQLHYSLSTTADTLADDGMKLWLCDGTEAGDAKELPDEAKFAQVIRNTAHTLEQLRVAPPAEPYAGPAILNARAAAVYFHESFGHRIEGHRQKDINEGRTFEKKLGEQIMPEFISVIDDPNCEKLHSKSLNGFYRVDEEGVPAQKVTLVDHGILKTFLMSRSPIKGCPFSNGHARCSPGYGPQARQGNLIVLASKTVPYEDLRTQLIAEAKKQGKSYGLIFDQVAGGFTMTQSMMPQIFQLQPLIVKRVYVDGRPDELIRGVDLLGTPLTSLEKILRAGNDYDTFNGTCGARSGWVGVSASSPSLLMQTIEVQRKPNTQEKMPVLPSPDRDTN